MTTPIIIHLANEEPILCDVDQLPEADDQIVTVHNPRRRDGKDVHYIDDDVTTIIIPWHRINFIEILPTPGEMDEVITFVRE